MLSKFAMHAHAKTPVVRGIEIIMNSELAGLNASFPSSLDVRRHLSKSHPFVAIPIVVVAGLCGLLPAAAGRTLWAGLSQAGVVRPIAQAVRLLCLTRIKIGAL